MITPRPYQVEALEAMHSPCEKGRMLVMATGTGKTVTAHLRVAEVLEAGGSVLWLGHRRELVVQARRTLERGWPELARHAGYLMAGLGDDVEARCLYAGKDTARARIDRIRQRFDLVVVDEVHLYTEKYHQLVMRLLAEHGERLGLTATPERTDGFRLEDHWEIVYDYDMAAAIDSGFLLRPYAAVTRPPDLDLSRVPESRRDYLPAELERELLAANIVEHTVRACSETYEATSLPFGRSEAAFCPREAGGGIIYCLSVAQAEATWTALLDAGWTAALITGETSPTHRADAIADFEAGRVQVLVNVACLTTGTDLPVANWCVLARPTRIWALFLQIVGRVLRPHDGQDKALIIDLVGATKEHSIIGAPVLVTAKDCDDSPDGRHRYLPVPTGEGKCHHCGDTIKCFASKGSHRFGKDGRCTRCGATQCPEGPDLVHHWVPWEEGTRMCVHCALELPDPLHSFVKRRNIDREPVEWKPLTIRGAEIWASCLKDGTILFNQRVEGGLWRPSMYRNRRLAWLARAPVPPDRARVLTDDVARRTRKVRGRFGGHSKRYDRDADYNLARIVARRELL